MMHFVQGDLFDPQVAIRMPATRRQVVVLNRPYAQLVIKSLIARDYVARVIITAVVLLAEKHLQQHAVIADAVLLVVRIINAHNTGSTVVPQIKKSTAFVNGNFVG